MKVITIGRSSQNEVVINDEKVSRNHIQIIQDDYGNFRLVDFGSTNGTFVNSRKVTGEISLSPNDVIVIGSTTLSWQNYFSTIVPPTGTMTGQRPPVVNLKNKQRHGFVTFWLWLGIIGSIFGVVGVIAIYVMFEDQMSSLRYQDGFDRIANAINSISSYYLTNVICTVISAIVGIILISFILKWRKFGFYGLAVSSVIFGSINLFIINKIGNALQDVGAAFDTTQQVILSVVGILFSTFILWAILQIKKNGVSCWNLLD
jgi:hypothetical protein